MIDACRGSNSNYFWHKALQGKMARKRLYKATSMKRPFYQAFKLAAIGMALYAGVTGLRGQSSFSMQIIADNDFAVFGGTATSVNDLIYQNDAGWPDQLNNLSTITFDLQPGDTTFYLLGMGGGGEENISGTVNGVDITTISVSMSSDISLYLGGYDLGAVAAGTYDASLSDVQTALPNLTWGSPTINNSDYVITQSPTGQGFHFDDSTAELFEFNAVDVGVTPTPEPSTGLLLAAAGAVIAASRGRRFFPPRV
jgi:hypothetical protein